ncbi:MAG: polysaccharide deacetylase family protein [Blautia sp.]
MWESESGTADSLRKKGENQAGRFVKETGSRLTGQSAGTAVEAPCVALTFDDGPNNLYTPRLLEGLKKRNIHATFFLMGKNIEGKEDLVLQMSQDGHLIGNHTYNHVELDKISKAAAKKEILQTNESIWEITGVYRNSFAHPMESGKKTWIFM